MMVFFDISFQFSDIYFFLQRLYNITGNFLFYQTLTGLMRGDKNELITQTVIHSD